MKRLKTLALTVLAVSTTLVACSESPTDVQPGASSEISDTVGEAVSTPGGALKWDVRHSDPLTPWQKMEFESFQAAVEDLVSGDEDRASEAMLALMEIDPNLYPYVLRTLTATADADMQRHIEETIAAYWDEYGGRPNGFSTGGEVTYEVTGKITTLPGSKIGVNVRIWGEVPIDVSGISIPINSGESSHECDTLVGTSTNSMTGATIPISLTLPGYGPVSSISVDLKLNVDITVILRYYECEKDEEEGEGH